MRSRCGRGGRIQAHFGTDVPRAGKVRSRPHGGVLATNLTRQFLDSSCMAASVDSWLETQPGSVARRLDVVATFSRHALDRALDCGQVVRVLPGIYAPARAAATSTSRSHAVAIWAPQAVISGSVALQVLGVKFQPPPTKLLVLLPYGSHVRAPSWLKVRTVQREMLTSRTVGRLRVASGPRALVDAWSAEEGDDRRSTVYQSLWARVAEPVDVLTTVARMPRVARRRALVSLLNHFVEGATSPLEVVAKTQVFVGARFAGFEWQGELQAGGRTRRVDMLHRDARLAVELDGARFHDDTVARARDRVRDLELALAGYVTLRFGWNEITRRPGWCRKVVLAALKARASSRT